MQSVNQTVQSMTTEIIHSGQSAKHEVFLFAVVKQRCNLAVQFRSNLTTYEMKRIVYLKSFHHVKYSITLFKACAEYHHAYSGAHKRPSLPWQNTCQYSQL